MEFVDRDPEKVEALASLKDELKQNHTVVFFMDSEELCLQVLKDVLRKIGVGFALEHYGIDQERFQILDILKPDYIKVDGELMHTLMTDTNLQRSVEIVVREAAKRNIKTIAERVENANAMAVLFQLGLDYMQGHYVHEPEVVLQDTDTHKTTSLAKLAAANGN